MSGASRAPSSTAAGDALADAELRRAYRFVDALPAGRAVFDDLARRFGVGRVHLDGGTDAVLKTYYAQGQRAVIDRIHRMLDEAEAAPAALPERSAAVAGFDFPFVPGEP